MGKEPLDGISKALDVCIRAPDTLAACFEGLGHLCEFGIVQSFCGADPVGLFRFSSIPHEKLIDLIETRLIKLDDPREIDLFSGRDNEWKVRIARYEMEFHTQRGVEDISKNDFLPKVRQRTAFLKRKFLEQLDGTEKVFVRRDVDSSPLDVRDLHNLISQQFQHRLLWVDHTNEASRIGTVEWVQQRLLRAYYGYFWPNAAPTPSGLGIWLRILESGLRALHPSRWDVIDAYVSRASESADQKLRNLGWYADHSATAVREQAIEPVHPDIPVIEHKLSEDLSVDNGPIFFCDTPALEAERIYVVSAWVWVPEAFTGWVGVTFPGSAWIHMWTVNLNQRNCWQRIVTSSRANSVTGRRPGLVVQAKMGEVFYSTGWRVERGCVPADCLALPGEREG